MLKKELTLALAALLAVAACAPCASGQSGRRLPREAPRRGVSGREVVRGDAAAEEAAAEAHGANARAADFDPRGLNAGRRPTVVYAEAGDRHPNKADKIAGAALLGYLVLFVWITAKSDGYAPAGGGTSAAGLRPGR